jgi:hypothetical protein
MALTSHYPTRSITIFEDNYDCSNKNPQFTFWQDIPAKTDRPVVLRRKMENKNVDAGNIMRSAAAAAAATATTTTAAATAHILAIALVAVTCPPSSP